MGIKRINIEKVAAAIEADAGESLPELRQALAEAKAGLGRVTTSVQMLVRQAREKSGLTQAAFAERIATPVATLSDWEQG
jgi:putative transcriptional regulator